MVDKATYYSRQLVLPEIGDKGQQAIESAKVLVVGAGGLGCPILEYLTRIGIGTIGVVDADNVAATNLHRQSLYTVSDIGVKKVSTAKSRLEQINPFVSIITHETMLTPENCFSILANYDIVVDATDNYPTRYLINDGCAILGLPLVFGAIYRFEGQVTVFNYNNGPTYRCLFPDFPSSESNTNCSSAGVLGVLPGIIGIMQATEVIKIILRTPDVLSGKLLTYNPLSCKSNLFKLKRKEEFDYLSLLEDQKLSHPYYAQSCNVVKEIDEVELLELIDNKKEILWVDVRESNELPKFDNVEVIKVPSSEGYLGLPQLDSTKLIVVFCKSGIRSKKACREIEQLNSNYNIYSLKEGITSTIIETWKKHHTKTVLEKMQ